jgi:hypothetical protein
MEHARAAPIARHRAHRAPIRHHCSVALAQDAGDGRIDFPISKKKSFGKLLTLANPE